MKSNPDFKNNTSFNSQQQILTRIKGDLFPEVHPSQFILKVLFFHGLSTALVMSFCPQFGLGLFKNGHYGLTSIFMQVSHEFCQMMCGLTLFSLSFFMIFLNLKMTEKEWLQEHKIFTFSIILLLTSSAFWMWAPEMSVMNLILWCVGALVSAGFADRRLQNAY